MKNWNFSLWLGVVYTAVFAAWMYLGRAGILWSALVATGLLSVLWLRAERQRYFRGFWDRLFHASVILDILLEAFLIRVHDNYSFVLCALAFAIVLGGYRWRELRRSAQAVAVESR